MTYPRLHASQRQGQGWHIKGQISSSLPLRTGLWGKNTMSTYKCCSSLTISWKLSFYGEYPASELLHSNMIQSLRTFYPLAESGDSSAAFVWYTKTVWNSSPLSPTAKTRALFFSLCFSWPLEIQVLSTPRKLYGDWWTHWFWQYKRE